MGRLFDREGEYIFEVDEIEIPLHENNFLANIHRQASYMDRLGVEDPRDNLFFVWYRSDQDPEVFNQMLRVAMEVGSVLLRDTPTTEVEAQFDRLHQLSDDEFTQFLEGENGE
jgi:hypothetical protein